jgi:excisionase family DNA binding protein
MGGDNGFGVRKAGRQRTSGLPLDYRPGRVYTTGQCAATMGASPRTAAKLIDSGELKGYRLPGSNDRRVAEHDLVAFLVRHGMPIPPALRTAAVLTYGVRDGETLDGGGHAADSFAFGALVERAAAVGVAVIGDAEGREAACRAARLVLDRHPTARVAVVWSEDAPACELPGVVAFRRPVAWGEVVMAVMGQEKAA